MAELASKLRFSPSYVAVIHLRAVAFLILNLYSLHCMGGAHMHASIIIITMKYSVVLYKGDSRDTLFLL